MGFLSRLAASSVACLLASSAFAQCGVGDFDHSGLVDGADLGALLAGWSQPGPWDLDGSGAVDGADLGILLASWGEVTLDAGVFPAQWISGGLNCPTETKIQVHAFNDGMTILRQSLCTNFEAPFMTILFGTQKALMMDSGAGNIPINATTQAVVTAWAAGNGLPPLQLVVAHTHGHGDHVAGNAQFSGQPNTVVVGNSQAAVKAFFGITNWPTQIVQYDLGNRIVDIIPIPGHQSAHIAFYDRQTGILFTGDTLYPGRLYISNFDEYLVSIDRLVEFVADKPVCWILGTHIEMSKTPGVDFPIGSTGHPNEHALQLTKDHLLELQAALQAMKGNPHYEVHDDFIIFPLNLPQQANGGAGDGDGEDPDACCDRPKTAFELRRVMRRGASAAPTGSSAGADS